MANKKYFYVILTIIVIVAIMACFGACDALKNNNNQGQELDLKLEGFELEQGNVYKARTSESTMDVSKIISIDTNHIYELYSDAKCSQQILVTELTLEIGDNYFYLVARSIINSQQSITYIIFIYREGEQEEEEEKPTYAAGYTGTLGETAPSATPNTRINKNMSAGAMLLAAMDNYYAADYAASATFVGGVQTTISSIKINQSIQTLKVRDNGDYYGYYVSSGIANVFEQYSTVGNTVFYRKANKVQLENALSIEDANGDSHSVRFVNENKCSFNDIETYSSLSDYERNHTTDFTKLWSYSVTRNTMSNYNAKVEELDDSYKFTIVLDVSKATADYINVFKYQLQSNMGMQVDSLEFKKLELECAVYKNGFFKYVAVHESYKMTLSRVPVIGSIKDMEIANDYVNEYSFDSSEEIPDYYFFAIGQGNSDPEKQGSVELQAVNAIVSGLRKSVEDGDMKDLKVDAELGLNVNDNTEYQIKLALDLDLLQYHGWTYTSVASTAEFDANTEYYKKYKNNEYERAYVASYNFDDVKSTLYTRAKKNTETAKQTNSWIDAEIIEVKKDGTATNKTLLGLYFSDKPSAAESKFAGVSEIYQGNTLYVQANTADGQKKMAFPAPFIGGVQAALDGQVDFSGIVLDENDFWYSLDAYLGIIADISKDGICTSEKASITIDAGILLDASPDNEYSLITLMKGLQGYLDALGLDLNATALGNFLPNITLTLSADLEDGKVMGVDISLGLSKKDISLKTIDKKNNNAKNELLVVKMDNAIDLTVSLDYIIGTATKFRPADLGSYQKMNNLLDASLSFDLYIQEAIDANVKIGDKNVDLEIPAGYYTISAQIAANPWEMLSHYKEYCFDGATASLESVKLILQAVDSLDLRVMHVKDASGAAIAMENQEVFRLLLANRYTEDADLYSLVVNLDGTERKYVTLNASIINDLSLQLDMDSLDDLIDVIAGFIPKEGQAPENPYTPVSMEEEDETYALLRTIGGYLLGAYIGINDGIAGHGDLYIYFNSSDTREGIIPLSGYTEWKGEYDSRFNYYTQTALESYRQVDGSETWDKNKTYYRYYPEQFVRVDTVSSRFDAKKCYYTRTGYGTYEEPYEYTLADITAFAEDVDYYIYVAASYDKADIYKESIFYDYVRDGLLYELVEATYERVNHPDFTDPTNKYYVLGISDGGDFGIGVQGSVAIEDGELTIVLSIQNMNVYGLPSSINIKLNNFDVTLFNNDYSVFVCDGICLYSNIESKIVD